MKKLVIIPLLLAFFSGLILYIQNSSSAQNTLQFDTKAMVGGTELSVAKALTPESWEKGLSGQRELTENQALLFVFDHSATYGIWMKDMLFPIDVLWIDQNYSVIFKKENFSPSSYPEVVYPKESALYVLELPAGFVAEHNINIGDRLSL